jgi:hypothetical protein
MQDVILIQKNLDTVFLDFPHQRVRSKIKWKWNPDMGQPESLVIKIIINNKCFF